MFVYIYPESKGIGMFFLNVKIKTNDEIRVSENISELAWSTYLLSQHSRGRGRRTEVQGHPGLYYISCLKPACTTSEPLSFSLCIFIIPTHHVHTHKLTPVSGHLMPSCDLCGHEAHT